MCVCHVVNKIYLLAYLDLRRYVMVQIGDVPFAALLRLLVSRCLRSANNTEAVFHRVALYETCRDLRSFHYAFRAVALPRLYTGLAEVRPRNFSPYAYNENPNLSKEKPDVSRIELQRAAAAGGKCWAEMGGERGGESRGSITRGAIN